VYSGCPGIFDINVSAFKYTFTVCPEIEYSPIYFCRLSLLLLAGELLSLLFVSAALVILFTLRLPFG
jgi:hypothetical protein